MADESMTKQHYHYSNTVNCFYLSNTFNRESPDTSLQKNFVGPEDASDSEDEGTETVTNPTNQTNPVVDTPAPTLMMPCIYCGEKYKVYIKNLSRLI